MIIDIELATKIIQLLQYLLLTVNGIVIVLLFYLWFRRKSGKSVLRNNYFITTKKRRKHLEKVSIAVVSPLLLSLALLLNTTNGLAQKETKIKENAQELNGSLTVNNRSDINLTEQFNAYKNNNPIHLFQDFAVKKYNISFSFKYIGETEKNLLKTPPVKQSKKMTEVPKAIQRSDLPVKDFNRFSYIRFRTIVKHNNEVIGDLTRKPFPYFPGDMFVGVETFDLIPILSHYANQNTLKQNPEVQTGILPPLLPRGEYMIQLQAIPLQAEFADEGYRVDRNSNIQQAVITFSITDQTPE